MRENKLKQPHHEDVTPMRGPTSRPKKSSGAGNRPKTVPGAGGDTSETTIPDPDEELNDMSEVPDLGESSDDDSDDDSEGGNSLSGIFGR